MAEPADLSCSCFCQRAEHADTNDALRQPICSLYVPIIPFAKVAQDMVCRADRPALIEITDEMVAEGLTAYEEHCPDTCSGSLLDAPMIREILERALSMSPHGASACAPVQRQRGC